MRGLLLTGAAVAFTASTAAQAADNYAPAPRYRVAPPPPAAYSAGPSVQAAPGFAEAPPPPYAQLPPPLAYPLPPQPYYPPAGYGPDPGWVYLAPPGVTYNCWWDGLGYRVCARPGW
jgi:hypothetical protein